MKIITNKINRFVKKFIEMESSSGLVMIFFTLLAIIFANTSLENLYKSFIHFKISLGSNHNLIEFTLKTFVKDVLMCVFFFIVGMELKYEMLQGNLSKKGQKILPLIAAIGGIIAPALIFFLFNFNHPENYKGWAVPTATDIAFALCILSLMGKAVPISAKVFLLAIAIYDDLAAIIIIALFYSAGVKIIPITLAIIGVIILYILNRLRIDNIIPYILTGFYLWICFHYSGVHTTIAGVILGLYIPLNGYKNQTQSPLKHLMHTIHPWVAFLILPLFAFVSSGVSFKTLSTEELFAPLTIGTALSLFVGKQLGIYLATFASYKLKIADKPDGSEWIDIYGVSIVAGIGFTMSLFVGMLAFKEPILQDEVKIGVIIGSLLSTILGFIIFKVIKNKNTNTNSL